MKIEALKDRIEKAAAKIEKKHNTIVKKTAQIEKKAAQLTKMGIAEPLNANRFDHCGSEAYWIICDIDGLRGDIKRGSKEIEEIKKTIAKYEAQLAGEIEKEEILLKEIPEIFKSLNDQLVAEWDAWGLKRRDHIKAQYKELGYKEFFKIFNGADYSMMDKSDKQLHDSNVRDAKAVILDLFHRVKEITGEITDWTNIKATAGTRGCVVLNGTVIGKEGRARVESIYAGGYNIQRLHIRVLVHSI